MHSNLKIKKPLQILMSVLVLGGLLLMPQASWAVLWVNSGGGGATPCYRGAIEPSPASNTCDSLITAASSSTSGETIHAAGSFSELLQLQFSNHQNTTWTNWSGQTAPTIIGTGNNQGILINGSGGGAHGVTVENFTINDANNEGIYIFNASDVTVQNSTIYENGRAGVFIDGAGGNAINTLIQRNYIYDNSTYGIEIAGIGGRDVFYVQDASIFNNIIYNQTINIRATIFSGLDIMNNTIVTPLGATATDIYLTGIGGPPTGDNPSVVDNILQITAESFGIVYTSGVPDALVSDYNDFYLTAANATSGQWLGSDEVTLADWQTASSLDTNSTDLNPNFDANYHLPQDSPLSSLGVNLFVETGITSDIDGDPRPNSQGDWSMGADQRDDRGPDPGVPEFSIFTLILALVAGVGIILLIGRLKRSENHI